MVRASPVEVVAGMVAMGGNAVAETVTVSNSWVVAGVVPGEIVAWDAVVGDSAAAVEEDAGVWGSMANPARGRTAKLVAIDPRRARGREGVFRCLRQYL